MVRRYILTAVSAALLACATLTASTDRRQAMVVSAENGFTAKPVSGSSVSVNGSSFGIVSPGWTSGVMFSGQWDLRDYSAVRFTIENKDSVHPLSILCDMTDSRAGSAEFKGKANTPKKGIYEGAAEVKPLSTKTIEMLLPPDLPHPEIHDMFRLMRGTPYSHALGLFSDDIDLSDVRSIAVTVYAGFAGVEYTVSDIRFIPGKRAVPEVIKLDSAAVFPILDQYGQYRHSEWKGKIHSDKDLAKALRAEEKDLAANPGPDEWDQWGGWLGGPRFEATGQFRVQKVDGKWWMIDPDGYLFWSHGVVRVTSSCSVTPLDGRRHYFTALPQDESDPMAQFYHTHDQLLHPYYVARGIKETYDFSSANAYRKYGPDYKSAYADMAHRRCRSWGINTMANSSDPDICAMDRTVYNERVDLGAPVEGYPEWPVLKGADGWWPFIDPFDPLFPMCVRAHLEAKRTQLEDPWCLGFYVDNEISWGKQSKFAGLAMKSAPNSACKTALVDELVRRYRSIEALNSAWGSSFQDWGALMSNREDLPEGAMADLESLTPLIVEKYFSVVRDVFKQVAPDKLYMGCRFSSAPEFVVRIAAKYCDVMSYNTYRFDMAAFSLPEGIDLPVVLGEFHFGGMDRGMFHTGLVYTSSQEGKGEAYEYYVRSCLRNPCVIGTNWHQFSDQPTSGRFDGENFQVGFTDCCDTPYPEMVRHLRNIGHDMYKIRYKD